MARVRNLAVLFGACCAPKLIHFIPRLSRKPPPKKPNVRNKRVSQTSESATFRRNAPLLHKTPFLSTTNNRNYFVRS